MNIEDSIIDIIEHFDSEWYRVMHSAFMKHPCFDRVDSKIKYEVQVIEDPTDFEIALCGDQKSSKIERFYDVEIGFEYYCWNGIEKRPVHPLHSLNEGLDLIFSKIEQAVTLVSDLEIKKQLLEKISNAVAIKIQKVKSENKGHYKMLMARLLFTFNNRLISQYNIIDSIISDFLAPAERKAKKPSDIKKTKLLSAGFFKFMLDWTNDERQPIIHPSEESKKEKYADELYQLYMGRVRDVALEMNFLWNKELVYYLLVLVSRTRKGFILSDFLEKNIIKIKGDRVKDANCRKGALNFEKKSPPMKKLIDDYFKEELDRSNNPVT